jgi:hypothetical protein
VILVCLFGICYVDGHVIIPHNDTQRNAYNKVNYVSVFQFCVEHLLDSTNMIVHIFEYTSSILLKHQELVE